MDGETDDTALLAGLSGSEIPTGPAADQPAPRRGRGRPRLSDAERATRAARPPIDAGPAGDGVTFPIGERRGSKRDRNLQGMENLLLAIHVMVAAATGYEDLILSPTEGHALADALANLADHYKIQLDGKAGAVVGLVYTASAIYGPRAVSIVMKARARVPDQTATT